MFRFNMGMDIYNVILEVYIGEQLVNKQQMQAPKEMLMINFIQLAEQIGNDSRPMKVRMARQESIWDRFEQRERVLTNEIEFRNNAMEE